MVAYVYRMPAGIPGDVNRAGTGCTIVPQNITPYGTTGAPSAYGVPGVIDATTGNFRTLTAGDTTVFGLLVRPYPTGSSQDPLGTSTPPNGTTVPGTCDVLRRGYMTVLLSGTTAAVAGAPVYVWTAAASGSHVTGGFEAANPGGSGFLVPNTTFSGPADSSGNVEIGYNI